jgi:hypothetical protein
LILHIGNININFVLIVDRYDRMPVSNILTNRHRSSCRNRFYILSTTSAGSDFYRSAQLQWPSILERGLLTGVLEPIPNIETTSVTISEYVKYFSEHVDNNRFVHCLFYYAVL